MTRTSRSPRAIVDHQVQRWSQEQKRTRWGRTPPPVITVSRQYGAMGAAIARSVAERLGFACWDQEILHAIAEHANAPRVMFESLDERRRNAVSEVIGVFAKEVTASEYLKELLRVLHTIAQHGEAVIVGRGAHYVLQPTSTLRIRVVAPLEVRLAGLAKRKEITENEAREEALAVDEERRDFIRHHYNRDIEDPTGYDLTINTGAISLELATDLVVAAYHGKFEKPKS